MLTYDQQRKATTILCNSCTATFHRSEAPFDIPSTVAAAKLAHWAIRRQAGEWQHFCPACEKARFKGKLL